MKDEHLIVEIRTNDEWEAGYRMRREDLDKVYKYMDLLQAEETNEVDISATTAAIEAEHERFNS